MIQNQTESEASNSTIKAGRQLSKSFIMTNLHKIPKFGAKIASIGGAETFDGIFLSGIIAVLLV